MKQKFNSGMITLQPLPLKFASHPPKSTCKPVPPTRSFDLYSTRPALINRPAKTASDYEIFDKATLIIPVCDYKRARLQSSSSGREKW